MVGISGHAGTRLLLVTPRPRSLPLLTVSCATDTLAKDITVSPLITEDTDSGVARYGTWVILTPAIMPKSSPDMCCEVPPPPEE